MGRTALYDKAAADELIGRQHGLITRAQARGCKLSEQALRRRLRLDGPWQVMLPGVYATFTGSATATQREMAALLYAGAGSVITGQTAIAAHGISAPVSVVDVLIPVQRKRRDHAFVHVLRTGKMPRIVYSVGEIRYVPPARAVADAVRQMSDIADARALVGAAVQRRQVTVADLAVELRQGPASGSGRLRAVLAEVADGVRSSAEADLRNLIKRAALPDPLYNPRLYLGEEFVAIPDAWWADVAVAVEVDSRQWHLSPGDWQKTMARHSRMSALGIIVLHYPPLRLRDEPRVVAAEIRSALEAAQGRVLPAFRVVPAG